MVVATRSLVLCHLLRASAQDALDSLSRMTLISGMNTAKANQKWLPEMIASSCSPAIGPSTACPSTFHVLPVPASTMVPSRFSNVSRHPPRNAANAPAEPTLQLPMMKPSSSAETAPDYQNATTGSPPISASITTCSVSAENAERAGTYSLTEIHGNMHWMLCVGCHARWSPETYVVDPEQLPPRCLEPGWDAMVEDDGVMFGEPIPPYALERCAAETRLADLFMIIGTTAQVYPATEYPQLAVR